jgi:regulator of cell morphogenesis and NO signaling
MDRQIATETVGDIVAADFRTAAIFERFGIDFCCGGRRSLSDACRTAAADPDEVIRALAEMPLAADGDGQFAQWGVGDLIDHIVLTHHAYVRATIPTIQRYLAKLVAVHGTRHPELQRIAASFEQIASELVQHMFKEEQILFPYMRDVAESAKHTCGAIVSPFGTVANPIRMMEREHQEAADGLRTIRALTRNYTPPSDGCTTYAVCMNELHRFEEDLHRHVHLENNVLFPKALELEGHGARADRDD